MTILTAQGASAAVTYIPYGVAVPKGQNQVLDFSTMSPAGREDSFFKGFSIGYDAAPAFSATTSDTAQYLSIKKGRSESFALAPTRTVSIYIGSLDTYNYISFGGQGAVNFTGAQLGAVSGAADGDQRAADTNGRFIFTFQQPVDSVTLFSLGNSFEVASIATSVPEPTTWALLLVGLGGMGMALRRRDREALPAA